MKLGLTSEGCDTERVLEGIVPTWEKNKCLCGEPRGEFVFGL